MQRHRRFPIGATLLALGALTTAINACQNTENTGGPGGTGGAGTGGGKPDGSTTASFTPKACSFSIAPRPEYKGFQEGTDETKAAPNIRRVRLGIGGKVEVGAAGRADPARTAAVAWQTDDGTFASDVAWGKEPSPAKWSASDRTAGVTWLTPEGSLNPQGDERMHEAYFCGLDPDTTYYYRVGGGREGSEVWSDVYTFSTQPAAGNGTVKFGITGDSRGQLNDAWRLIQRRMRAAGVGVQLFSGDMINLAPNQGEWQQWLDAAWKDTDGSLLTLGQLLTLAAHGNHDNHTALFFGSLVLPQDPEKYSKYGELFFSMDVGPVHVIVIDDAAIVVPTGDTEYQPVLEGWLKADLEAANQNRAKVPWIVAMHHHPEYSSSLHGKDSDVLRGREFFTPIWDEHHVDLIVSGHDHNYERSKPLTGPASSPTVQADFADGSVYLVCAGSGADSYTAGTSPFTAKSQDFVSGGALGLYGILTATATKLELQAHELRADGSDPVFDTMTIDK